MTKLDAPASHDIDRLLAPDEALGELLRELGARDYAFVTPTPASHERVLARSPDRPAANLREVFGWNLPFAADLSMPSCSRR